MNAEETASVLDEESDKTILLALLKKHLPTAAVTLVSGLMSRAVLPGGYLPLGAGFIAAVPQEFAAAATAGGVIGCITGGGMLTSTEGLRHVSALLAVGGIRWALGELRTVNRARFYPFFAALAGVMMTGTVIRGATGSILSYSTLYFAIEGIMAGLAAMFFSEACGAAEKFGSGGRLGHLTSVSLIITLCAAAIPLCRMRISGISPGMILIHSIVILIATARRETGGAISGIAAGCTSALARFSLIQGEVIPVAALLTGYAAVYGRIFAASAYLACCFIGCLFGGNLDYLFVAEAAAGSVLSCLIPAVYAERALEAVGFHDPEMSLCTSERDSRAKNRLSRASEAIDGVRTVLGKVSDGLEKRCLPDDDSIYSRAVNEICSGCTLRGSCPGTAGNGSGERINRLAERLKKGRSVSGREISEALGMKCAREDELAGEINRRYGYYLASRSALSRMSSIRSVVNGQLEGVGILLDRLGRELGEEWPETPCELKPEKYSVEFTAAQHCCGGEVLCGDSYEFFDDGTGNCYMLLSDGMGSGGRAAVEGALTCELFKQLLLGGFDFGSSVKLVNSALMIKSEDETLSTADCFCMNLRSGRSVISKAGAAQSYHIRKGLVTRIDLPSLPLGILCETDTSQYTFTAEEGDMIVMISDGVPTDSSMWFEDMLRSYGGQPAKDFAELLLQSAVSRRPEGDDDDITVAIGTVRSIFPQTA